MSTLPSRTSLAFHKSSYSGNNGGCVEAATEGRRSYVADTKDPTGPMLPFAGSSWTAFLSGVKSAGA